MITVLTAFGLSDSTVVTEKERNIKKSPTDEWAEKWVDELGDI